MKQASKKSLLNCNTILNFRLLNKLNVIVKIFSKRVLHNQALKVKISSTAKIQAVFPESMLLNLKLTSFPLRNDIS